MEGEDIRLSHQYEKRPDGKYVLRDAAGQMLVSTDCPAVLFDRDSGTLHKHGDFDRIRLLLAEMRVKCAKSGNAKLGLLLQMYGSPNFDVDELNKCLNVAGYCKQMMDRLSKQ